MMNDNFEERILADMNIALERACENLSIVHGDHPVRKFVAELRLVNTRHMPPRNVATPLWFEAKPILRTPSKFLSRGQV